MKAKAIAKRKVSATTSKRGTTDVDRAIGLKIRQRRTALGLSQDVLAKNLGVSFQQIQKYEQGTNRVPMSRLAVVARLFEVPIIFFYGAPAGGKVVTGFKNLDPLSIRAIKAYSRIGSKDLRHQLVVLVERIADDQN